jgi:polyvinyl alcohol dehydrogenase (cytochrome)
MKLNNTLNIKSIIIALLVSVGSYTTVLAAGGGGLWKSSGQDVTNNRHQAQEHKIGAGNVEDLVVKWDLPTAGPVSATPSVDGDNVYFPDFGGYLYALNRDTGEIVWKTKVADYVVGGSLTAPPNNYSRATPAIAGNLLIFGDQGGRAALESFNIFTTGSARVMAVDKRSGTLVWSTQVDEHYAAIVTSSATVHGNVAYVGVASYEEAYAGFLPPDVVDYQCCSFRGSVVALDVNTGAIVWKTYMAPHTSPGSGPDYSGNAVWGSAPVVDTKRNAIYVATGNNYSVPDSVAQCITEAGDDGMAQAACLASNNYLDAVVSLDMKTGAVNWSKTVIPFDTWNVGCLDIGIPIPDPSQCPEPQGPDFDFGQAPMLCTIGKGENRQDRLGVGQKSGQFWSLDADTGEILEEKQVTPGGVAGGMIWGSATDGERLYTSSANAEFNLWTPVGGVPTVSGGWSALDPTDLSILWQTANPAVWPANAGGAVTVANGVVYGCAQTSPFPGAPDMPENMFAMDAATGEILWAHTSGGSCNSGAAVVNGMLFWGYGYPGGLGGSGFKAFGLDD